jgi:hypothetical protein
MHSNGITSMLKRLSHIHYQPLASVLAKGRARCEIDDPWNVFNDLAISFKLTREPENGVGFTLANLL